MPKQSHLLIRYKFVCRGVHNFDLCHFIPQQHTMNQDQSTKQTKNAVQNCSHTPTCAFIDVVWCETVKFLVVITKFDAIVERIVTACSWFVI